MPQRTLVIFSHLRWDAPRQRPQHLLSRLAARRRIVFFEEPVAGAPGEPRVEYSIPEPNVLVCRPHTPCRMPGFHDNQLPHLIGLLNGVVRDFHLKDYLLWFLTPMALPLAKALCPHGIIYDCMDDLAAFPNAPRQMTQRETALLRMADLVFSGGPSLHRAKKSLHPHVFCFPGSVDHDHFRPVGAGTADADLQKGIPGPRLGYLGALDERLDFQLLDRVALARPEWQIVMVGPLAGLAPASLPRRPNLHYLGQQPDADLPAYVAGWDVCLLPFALTRATRCTSPPMTLEYMAAEKPIVSTPLADVAEPFGSLVYLGGTTQSFISACHQALFPQPAEHQRRLAGMRDVLSHTSWDATAKAIDIVIASELDRKSRQLRLSTFPPVAA